MVIIVFVVVIVVSLGLRPSEPDRPGAGGSNLASLVGVLEVDSDFGGGLNSDLI